MATPARDVPPSGAPAPFPIPSAPAAQEETIATEQTPPAEQKVSALYIWLQVLGQFGVFIAFITPIAISLSIRLAELAPGREEYLGYITGSGALVVMLTGPLLGTLSDRTRTRLGRRRPFLIVGTLLGIVSLIVMALAPNPLVLGAGWILAQLGWGQVLANLQISMADRLPESQRGKVAGLTGFATQVAPVFGVVIAGGFASDSLLLFLLPGAVGVLFVALFVLFIKEQDSRGNVFEERLSPKTIFSKYIFNPRQYPDFSWVWLGRFLFYFGLTLNTTFTAFFFASRLGVEVVDVAPLIATLGLFGIIATTVGAIGGGFLSDRLRRRRTFVLLGSVLFAGGAAVAAFATAVPQLYIGSLLTSVGIGVFAAVDQALMLDVLPEKETSAGRYLGIIGFAVSIPQAAAPFIAPVFLAVGASVAGDKNYTLLYLIAGAFTIIGGLVVMRVKSVR
ncbi:MULTISPECIES: MFS transporter [unclassified Rathayibacter]|uniref:MFS transporter n=1 Tax=unclassified Rathayibacter TaxID=2609250 RepID=UPI0006F9E9D6|nr:MULTISPECIES: MFS transporter [unclassified Rathayibacter]KQQ04186.1 MFS transporter [Rathayibacter sp. Leaf294]KQS12639.1 MFS transporter [Rathayibacter sp. Leaf185]